jgi:transcriptional regulator with XRE-family HTH domain
MSAIKKNDNDQFDQAIGFRLKMLRQSCRMSQTELGEMLGTSYQQIQRLEAGINRMSPEKLFACAKIFKVPVSYFFDTETHDEINKFDKRVITIASAIASLPNPDIAQQIYRLAMTIGTDEK